MLPLIKVADLYIMLRSQVQAKREKNWKCQVYVSEETKISDIRERLFGAT